MSQIKQAKRKHPPLKPFMGQSDWVGKGVAIVRIPEGTSKEAAQGATSKAKEMAKRNSSIY